MESSPAVDFQSSQLCQFMAGINKELEDHVISKSAKYAFDFAQEKPMEGEDREF